MKVKYLKVVDGKRLNIAAFPNFSVSGNVKRMKELYYGKDALLVRCGSFIYYVGNLSKISSYGSRIYFNEAY